MMEKMIAREQNKADKEAEEWLKGVQEYLTQGGGQVKPAELAVALRGIKERLDEYMEGSFCASVLCKLLLEKGVISDAELEEAKAKLQEEQKAKEEPECASQDSLEGRLIEAHRLMGIAVDTHDPEITELASAKLRRIVAMMHGEGDDCVGEEDFGGDPAAGKTLRGAGLPGYV